jgi:sulfonate transport system substrate-binding protein
MKKVIVSFMLLVALMFSSGLVFAQDGAKPAAVRLDWATYNLPSVVLKKFGWLEKALKKDGIPVTWVQSTGSNKANEFLASGSVDFNSTAGSAALLARSNGVELKTVYVYARPGWIQLVVTKDSPILTLADLKGKKIAVAPGTDAFFFLLQSILSAGLQQSDVQLVFLNQPDGHTAWARGNVDAWSALDPFLAQALLHENGRSLYKNIDFLTFGTLNVSDDFLTKYPDYVKLVIKEYERARKWVVAHPDETAQLLADEAHTDLDVAKQVVSRVDEKNHVGIPDSTLHDTLATLVPILTQQKLVKGDADPAKALGDLIDPTLASQVLGDSASPGTTKN